MPHAFFASYARADNKGDLVREIIEDLTERVASLLGVDDDELDADDKVCFFDSSSIEAGEDWERYLSSAVNRAKVLVCLCSPRFFARAHCAKEFAVFRQRIEALDDATDVEQRVVIPVIWQAGGRMPSVLQRLQRYQDAGQLPDRYHEAGLKKLKELRLEVELVESLDALAEIIAARVKAGTDLPPLGSQPRFDQLPSSFDSVVSERADVAVAFLHASGAAWRPVAHHPSIHELVDEAAVEGASLRWRELVPTGDFRAAVENARLAGESLVAICSAPDLESMAWSTHVEAMTAAGAAILCGLERGEGVPAHGAAIARSFPIGGPIARVRSTLHEMFMTVRLERTKDAPVSPVRSDSHEAAAHRRGVDISTRPNVSGPGRA